MRANVTVGFFALMVVAAFFGHLLGHWVLSL